MVDAGADAVPACRLKSIASAEPAAVRATADTLHVYGREFVALVDAAAAYGWE